MATFVPGAFGVRTDYNFVSTMSGLHKPDIDSQLTNRYGTQLLTEFYEFFGKSVGTSALEYIHYEEDRIYPKFMATSPGGAAGAGVTLTLSGSSDTIPQNASPYVGTPINVTAIPVRIGDIIGINAASGTPTSASVVQCQVYSINAGAGTIVVYPTVSGTSVPVISGASEVIILTSASGEGSDQPAPLASTVSKYTNNLMIIRDTFEITGTEADLVTWLKFEDPKTGEAKFGYEIKGEADTYKRFQIRKENALLTGRKLSNVTLADLQATAGTPTTITEGLFTGIESRGNNVSYSGLSSLDLSFFEGIIKTAQTQVAAKVNMLPCGINLALQLDDVLANRFVNGGVTYGAFNMNQDLAVNMQFKSFQMGSYTFHKKTIESFSDLQTFGAAGFGYADEGMIIPMDNVIEAKTKATVPAMRTRYLVAPDGSNSRMDKTTVWNGFTQGDNGTDKTQVRYLAHIGLETFALNRFFKITKA